MLDGGYFVSVSSRPRVPSYAIGRDRGEEWPRVLRYLRLYPTLLYYKKFVKSLKSQALKLNPYEECVANKIVKGKQITVYFHVDDCKISHEAPQVIDETIDWLKAEYESIFEDGSGEMKVHRGKVHKYLGIFSGFHQQGTVYRHDE